MKAQLQITAGFKNGKTFLKRCYFTQPFKVGNVTEDRSASLLKLMVMSSSPGILDNDYYETEIEIQEDARLQIVTQAYQRLFNMKNGAHQLMNVNLKNNASFCYLPHPVVPHKQANYSSVSNIFLQNNHRLIWGEIITCGRKLSGEEFVFTKFQSVTNVYVENNLIIKENILLEPLKANLRGIGQLEGYTHQSNLLFLNNGADAGNLMQRCKQFLSGISSIEYGISQLPVNGFMVRMLGYKGEQLFDCHMQLALLIEHSAKAALYSSGNY